MIMTVELDRVGEALRALKAGGSGAIMADGTRAMDVMVPSSGGPKRLLDTTAEDLREVSQMFKDEAKRAIAEADQYEAGLREHDRLQWGK
jgi:hypothetical protein